MEDKSKLEDAFLYLAQGVENTNIQLPLLQGPGESITSAPGLEEYRGGSLALESGGDHSGLWGCGVDKDSSGLQEVLLSEETYTDLWTTNKVL